MLQSFEFNGQENKNISLQPSFVEMMILGKILAEHS